MTPLSPTDITAVVAAVTGPVSDNFLAIVTLLATVAGIGLVFKYIKRGAK